MEAHGNALDDDTLVAIRRVKHALVKEGGATGFELTSSLRTSVKHSWQRYQNDLLRKRNTSSSTSGSSAITNGSSTKRDEVKEIDVKIREVESGIKVAEKAVVDGNEAMKENLKASTVNRQKLIEASQLIEMGVGRKRVLSEELEELRKRRLTGK